MSLSCICHEWLGLLFPDPLEILVQWLWSISLKWTLWKLLLPTLRKFLLILSSCLRTLPGLGMRHVVSRDAFHRTLLTSVTLPSAEILHFPRCKPFLQVSYCIQIPTALNLVMEAPAIGSWENTITVVQKIYQLSQVWLWISGYLTLFNMLRWRSDEASNIKSVRSSLRTWVNSTWKKIEVHQPRVSSTDWVLRSPISNLLTNSFEQIYPTLFLYPSIAKMKRKVRRVPLSKILEILLENW